MQKTVIQTLPKDTHLHSWSLRVIYNEDSYIHTLANRCSGFLYYMMFCTDLAHIFLYIWKGRGPMSIHFFCNTKKSSVNYLCYAISNAFPCKCMPYFRRYKFFVISCRIWVYMCDVRESRWYESIKECFYELAYNKISVHLVYVDLLFLKSKSFRKGDLCVH